MKFIVLGMVAWLSVSASGQAWGQGNAGLELPHLELELDSRAYESLLEAKRATSLRSSLDAPAMEGQLDDLIALGKRSLDFLEHLNSKRPSEERLSLTSPALQPGYPIDAPKESSPSILRAKLADLKRALPRELSEIWFGAGSFPDSLSLSDEDYLAFARRMDGIYQGASRWTLQEPYLEGYKARQKQDVRGYYFLTHEPGWEEKLSNWAGLSEAEKERFRPWVVGICVNSTGDSRSCSREWAAAEPSPEQTASFVSRYLPRAERLWNSYFALVGRRSDVDWRRSTPEVMRFPFQDPRDAAVRQFLLENIEEEWQKESWNLRLDFAGSGWNTARIVFEAGATPHVNGLGGSVITMDANQPLAEYGTRWTIRHEFGHVLGLPDCYVEFYDTQKEAMISYQLDLDNLMCSRRGKFQQIHFDELKKAYFR